MTKKLRRPKRWCPHCRKAHRANAPGSNRECSRKPNLPAKPKTYETLLIGDAELGLRPAPQTQRPGGHMNRYTQRVKIF